MLNGLTLPEMPRLLLAALLLGCSLATYGQEKRLIQLPVHARMPIHHYQIVHVQDERDDAKEIGRITTPGGVAALVIPTGASAGIQAYLNARLRSSDDATRIAFHITTLRISGSVNDRIQDVEIATGFAFYKDGQRLVAYTGLATFQKSPDDRQAIAEGLARAIDSACLRFDKWWEKEQNKPRLDGATQYEVVLQDNGGGEGLYGYSMADKLTWADFRGVPPRDVQEVAMTSSGMKLNFATVAERGRTIVRMLVTPYFNPAESWVKEGASAAVLEHEKTHYKITLIHACRLVQALRNEALDAKSARSRPKVLFEQAMEEARNRQIAYDEETAHGIVPEAQRRWQEAVAKEFRDCGCF